LVSSPTPGAGPGTNLAYWDLRFTGLPWEQGAKSPEIQDKDTVPWGRWVKRRGIPVSNEDSACQAGTSRALHTVRGEVSRSMRRHPGVGREFGPQGTILIR